MFQYNTSIPRRPHAESFVCIEFGQDCWTKSECMGTHDCQIKLVSSSSGSTHKDGNHTDRQLYACTFKRKAPVCAGALSATIAACNVDPKLAVDTAYRYCPVLLSFCTGHSFWKLLQSKCVVHVVKGKKETRISLVGLAALCRHDRPTMASPKEGFATAVTFVSRSESHRIYTPGTVHH